MSLLKVRVRIIVYHNTAMHTRTYIIECDITTCIITVASKRLANLIGCFIEYWVLHKALNVAEDTHIHLYGQIHFSQKG